jgi:hypothetical protein
MSKIKDFSKMTFEYNCDRPLQFLSNKTKDIELKKQLKNKHFKQKLINDLANHFEFLGYDLNKEYLISYVNLKNINSGNNPFREKDLKVFNWKTTTGGWYDTNIWDYFLKSSFKTRKYCNIKDHILSHVFPLETTSPRVNKNIVNKNYIKQLKYASTAVGSSIKEKSNMLVIDIDCHDNNISKTDEQVNKLKSYLNTFDCYPVMEEISPEGGHHIYIRLDSEYTWKEKISWLKQFNKDNNTNFELPQKMRFPHCYQYETITKEGEIISPLEAITYVKRNRTYINIPKIEEQENIIAIPETYIIPQKKKRIVSAVYKRLGKNIGTIKQTDYEIFMNTKVANLKTGPEVITISARNRHYNMLKIIRVGKFSGWSIEQILSAVRICDNGSRDLAKWDNTFLYNKIVNLYNDCNPTNNWNFTEYKEFDFISNLDKIPENIKSTLYNKEVIHSILSNCGLKITNRNIKDVSLIISEMIGSLYYNCIIPKEIHKGQSTKYLKGHQFSINYAEKLKNYYPELQNRNVFGIINSILKNSRIFKQYMFCKRGWIYSKAKPELNVCRLFYLNNNVYNSIITFKDTLSFHILKSLLNIISNFKTKQNYLLYKIFLNKINEILDTLSMELAYKTDVG